MHFAICDDDIDELSRIANLLEIYNQQKGNLITYEAFHSATELLLTLNQRQFDLLLLDILMPGVSGMEAAKEIRQNNNQIPIIFLTSSKEFAIEGYRVNAEDYILKPVQTAEIFSALDKLCLKIAQEEAYITLKTQGNLLRLPLSQIVCIEVISHKLQFTLASGEIKETYGKLLDFEKDLLASTYFLKPHRSYLVNLHHVTTLDKTSFTTTIGKTIPVARGLFSQTKTTYMKYLFSGKGDA